MTRTTRKPLNKCVFHGLAWRMSWLCRHISAALILLVGWPAQAADLVLPPSAELTASRVETLSSLRLPTGPFAQGVLPTELVEGAVEISAFRLPLEAGSTLGLMQMLRDQLAALGFVETFSCETTACGGYDFRFGLDVLAEPDMHVNLGDFRYLSAKGQGDARLTVLVSRAGQVGYVQLTRVSSLPGGVSIAPAVKESPTQSQPMAPPAQPTVLSVGATLEAGLSVVLDDLVFPSGSSNLANESYASLEELAEWLKANPARQVVLVGHTDASGALEANIALSKLRAESVRQVLMAKWRLPPIQLRAEGIGPLSPRASNLTEEGRRQNRRVEVMATSTPVP